MGLQLETFGNQLATLAEMASDMEILYNKDAYDAALRQYKYIRYLSETDTPGTTEIAEDLRQFFEREGGGGAPQP